MPRSSNGTYTLPPGYLATTGQDILASQHNPPLEDLASSMTQSLPRTGVAPMLANLPMGGFKATGMGDGVAASDAATVGQVSAAYGSQIAGAADKATPVDVDYLPLYDSAASNALRKLTWANLKAALQRFVSTAAGTLFTLESSDAGTASGPDLDLYRNSASPAANDVLASLLFDGKDSAGNKELYAAIRAILKSPTSTSEAGEIVLRTIVAGALADRLHVGAGAYMEGASGGDKGAGTFNATQLYEAGSRVLSVSTYASNTIYSGTIQDNLDFPVGSYVWAAANAANRNQTYALYLFGTNGFSTAVSGTPLTGTWRARGARIDGTVAHSLFQRVS